MSETERLRAKKKQIYEDLKDAVARECVDSLHGRIKLLEKRVIDLQGHDDLSYIDKKLSEQERVERLRAEKKQIYEDIKDAVEAKLKEKNGERVMKNRHGVEYSYVKYDDNLYRFNMSEKGMKYSRYGGKEDQEGIDPNDLGFFDPSGGPFVAVGSKIYWDEIHEATKQEPLTVTRIMDRGAEGLFVEVE